MSLKRASRLDKEDHRKLVLWALHCAGHVLRYFEEKHPGDVRPRRAIKAGRAWVRGEMTVPQARAAAFAAHAAARDAKDPAARAAARAAGQAVATAHVPGHARHAAAYAVTAAVAAADPAEAAVGATEHTWQYQRLPKHLRSVVELDRKGRRGESGRGA
ncbi:MAG TPA: hypothetical protein PKY77_13155 [Phycisphaerae bacterium]|nr:hypothetical protein [Phycisphaerae bacterium]HRY68112.1 hypothetical protein [Phycisphaerae bacterium]HSA28805.1 hypothetical protein [Phycisphaerae bacterium]